jgi:hypothetical protein
MKINFINGSLNPSMLFDEHKLWCQKVNLIPFWQWQNDKAMLKTSWGIRLKGRIQKSRLASPHPFYVNSSAQNWGSLTQKSAEEFNDDTLSEYSDIDNELGLGYNKLGGVYESTTTFQLWSAESEFSDHYLTKRPRYRTNIECVWQSIERIELRAKASSVSSDSLADSLFSNVALAFPITFRPRNLQDYRIAPTRTDNFDYVLDNKLNPKGKTAEGCLVLFFMGRICRIGFANYPPLVRH